MAKLNATITDSTADGKSKENIKAIYDALSGETSADIEIKSDSTFESKCATTFSNAVVEMSALPTNDPSVAGVLWNDGGAVKVSAG